MVKLKIGTVEKKKEKKPAKMEDYYDTLSDETLSELQEKIEDNEIIENLQEEETEEVEEAVNGLNIYSKVGINPKGVLKFNELYPNKKTIYRNLITKQFLEWYIQNCSIDSLKKLEFLSDYINSSQHDKIAKLVNARLHEEIELEDDYEDEAEELTKKANKSHKKLVEMKNKKQEDIYELILHEQWDDREKGIFELDLMIREQLKINSEDLDATLKYLVKAFGLTDKLKSLHTLQKKKKINS